MISEHDLQEKDGAIVPRHDERQRRLSAAADALFLGRGGVSTVARASGRSRPPIHRGRAELAAGSPCDRRIRNAGGGRKRLAERDPTLLGALEALVAPLTRGEPLSPLRGTCQSTRQLAEALGQQGQAIRAPTVATLLHDLGYRLQANAKTRAGADHPDRAQPFHSINTPVKKYFQHKAPVISVATTKQELGGLYKNPRQGWRKTGQPRPVNGHDFPDKMRGKAIPYGVYDMGQKVGGVNVGGDNDTASFASERIRRWWLHLGQPRYPKARQWLLGADSGGSQGSRVRLWKRERQALVTTLGLAVTVCHCPPGTSTSTKLAPRLFCHISMHWRGHPLIRHEVIVELIAATTTKSGLTVTANLDTKAYPTKIKVSDEEMARLNLRPHAGQGEWN
jgi:Rhodopirellula transposase DDE domain